ncbi:hypothetical protein [Yinghuangia sp. YIM S09857]|uniref:hypothetical protein n=1 Tax=Yinghuangia sp. YIM S09857 TaxID=3436929 RepID=UPI003F5327B8
MRPTGVIFAALDCDADVIEDWNRWYDLEHTPPNLLLDGVLQSRRYVAPPALHEARIAAEGSPFAGGRSTFLTVYTLLGDPVAAFQGMTGLRDVLVEAGRMEFPADKKAVRDGDVFATVAGTGDDAIRLPADEVAFVGHTGIVVTQRRGGAEAARARAARLVALDGVHGVWTLASGTRDGLELDIVFVEGDEAETARRLRAAEPHDAATEIVVDAPYRLIDSLRYPWADEIRASDLPAKVGG